MLNEIADQHDKINAFHFGDFLEAISSDAVTYPLMVATPTPANMSFKKYNVSLDIVLADKYIEDNIEMRNGVLSDMMLISSDIRALFRQPEYDDFDIAESITVNPFVNKGGDITCGVIMTVQLRVDDLMDFCIVPTNGTPSPTPSCDDAIVENSDVSFQENIPSGDTYVLEDYDFEFQDENGNVLSNEIRPAMIAETFIIGSTGVCETEFVYGLYVNGISYGNITIDVLDDINITT